MRGVLRQTIRQIQFQFQGRHICFLRCSHYAPLIYKVNALTQRISYTAYTNYYNYEYAKYDGYKEKKVNGSSSYFQPGATTVTYDVNGAAIAVSETFRTSKNRSFVVDSTGRILQKTENGGTQRYFYANDKPVGSSGALAAADFDYNYTPVTDQYPALVPGNYVVSAGDTLRGIALAVYGDAQLWYLIADANGLQTDAELTVGRNLTIPNKVTNLRNAYDTYKPYEPGKIIGDLTPTLPEPPPPDNDDGGCGGLGGIFVAIIAVVVAFVFQQWYVLTEVGAALSAAAAVGTPVVEAGLIAMSVEASATIVGATIGGALGNIASQAVGMALGIQDKFSWGNVALAAIGGGLSEGLGASGSPLSGSGLGMTVARAMVGSAITQGVGVAVGLQDKFDWKGVAAAGVGAGVGYGMNQILPQAGPGNSFSSVMRDTAIRFASNVARQAVYGGRINFANVAADAFGNALGSSIAYSATAANSAAQQEQALDNAEPLAASGTASSFGGVADHSAVHALAGDWGGPANDALAAPYDDGIRDDMDADMSGRIRSVRVPAGSNLSRVAGTGDIDTLDRIAQYNGLHSRHEVRAGQNLLIPDAEILSRIAVSDSVLEQGAAGAKYYAELQEQRRIEAAQRASDSELYREANRAHPAQANSPAPMWQIGGNPQDVAPGLLGYDLHGTQSGVTFQDPDGGRRFMMELANTPAAAVNLLADGVVQGLKGYRYLVSAGTDAVGMTNGALNREIEQYGGLDGRFVPYFGDGPNAGQGAEIFVGLAGPTLMSGAGAALSARLNSVAPNVRISSFAAEASVGAEVSVGAKGGLATGADEAVFWSGIRGGSDSAASWAASRSGTTLESLTRARGVELPVWDPANAASVAAWRNASIDFATGARGNIRVLQGDTLRLDAIWRDEFRALRANPNVNSIRSINPETGAEVTLWPR